MNAWPLDEGLIDYVDAALYGEESEENPLYTANVIASPELRIGADVVDAKEITPELLQASCRAPRASRRTSPPAIMRSSFCSGARILTAPGRAPASGPRPTIRQAPARMGTATVARAYLKAATELLDHRPAGDGGQLEGRRRGAQADRRQGSGRRAVDHPDRPRLALLRRARGRADKLGLLLHDPEEEHDCFSDNTHNSHYYDEIGMARDLERQIHPRRRLRRRRAVDPRLCRGQVAGGGDARRRGVQGRRRQDAGAEGHGRFRQDGPTTR